MTFNIYGLAAVLFLILLAIFVRWIFGENLRIKWSKIKTQKTQTAIFVFKQEIVKHDKKWVLVPKDNFLLSQISVKNSYINIPKNFDNNSIYAYTNAFYLLNKFVYSEKKYFQIENILKWVQFFLFINFAWTISANLLIIALVFAGIFLLIILFDTVISFQKSKLWFQKTQLLLGKELDEQDYIICKKYLKYKKYFWLYKHLIIFFEPFFVLFKIFMEWGRHE